MRKRAKPSGSFCLPTKSLFAKASSICKNAISLCVNKDISSIAASLAFTTIFSIVPAFAVLFYFFKLFGGLEFGYNKIEPLILSYLSEGSGETVTQHLRSFIKNVRATAIGWAGLAGLIFTALSTYLTISKAFSRIWEIEDSRPFASRLLSGLAVITIGPILAILSIAVTTIISTQTTRIPYSGLFITLVLNILLFTIVYSLIPSKRLPFKTVLIGSLLPALLWEGAKSSYAFYTAKVVKYHTFYGSLAAIPTFFFWVYIAWIITLFGAVWIRTLHLHYDKHTIK